MQLKLNEMHALTEALRSFVLRVALGDGPARRQSARTPVLVDELSTDIIQRVTQLNMDIHGAEGCMMRRARRQARARRDDLDAPRGRHVQRVKILKRLQGAKAPSAGAH